MKRLALRMFSALGASLLSRHRNFPAVLVYEGVTASSGSATRRCGQLTEESLARQIQYIRRTCNVVRLSDVIGFCNGCLSVPGRSVAVTFDHAYDTTFRIAKPILEAHGVAATFFCASDFVGSEKLLWMDKAKVLLDRLRGGPRDTQTFWRKINEILKGYCHVSSGSLASVLARVPKYLKDEVIACLEAEFGWSPNASDFPDLRGLTLESLNEIGKSSLFEIGAHGSTYEILTQCSPAVAKRQVEASEKRLSRLIGSDVISFAYPNGEFNADVKEGVSAAGFRCAVTTASGLVEVKDPFAIPRIPIGPQVAGGIDVFKLAIAGLLTLGKAGPQSLVKSYAKRMIPRKLWDDVAARVRERRERRRKPTLKKGFRMPSLRHDIRPSKRIRFVHFVCQGNICRSAFASAFFNTLVSDTEIQASSSGLWAKEGRHAELYAIEVARRFDVALDNHRATRTCASLLRKADLIICFERWHLAGCLALNESVRAKLCLLGSLRRQNGNLEIADPFGKTFREFERSVAEIAALTCDLAEEIRCDRPVRRPARVWEARIEGTT